MCKYIVENGVCKPKFTRTRRDFFFKELSFRSSARNRFYLTPQNQELRFEGAFARLNFRGLARDTLRLYVSALLFVLFPPPQMVTKTYDSNINLTMSSTEQKEVKCQTIHMANDIRAYRIREKNHIEYMRP